jgi:ferric enterobactin receptor
MNNQPEGYSCVFLFFLILFFQFSCSIQAQQSENSGVGRITGRIVDSVSGQPVEYAAINLLTQEDGKVINGNTTDSKGLFKLTDIADGTYKIVIYFVGYQTGFINNVLINKTNSNIALGDIKLASKSTSLKGVTVSADKSIIEDKIDKMVYNADKDITSSGGVATDLLKKIPQISVDIDGNIELQGNSSILFLINGKPSTIFGNNITDVLQSIPASQIQSIEVITSPGAKYDASGTGGIINIILKKSTAEGVNGSVSLSGGTRLENGSLNLNAHHKHFSANAFLSGNAQLSSVTTTNMNRISQDTIAMQTAQLIQNGTSDFSRYGYQSGVGFDWDISPLNNISGSFGYNYFGNSNAGTVNRQSPIFDASGNTLSDIFDIVNTTNKFHEYSIDYDLTYKKKFKKEDQELEISANSSYGNNYSYYDQIQKYVTPDSIVGASYGNDPGIENEMNYTIDYKQPLGDDAILETGAKATFTEIKSTSDVYLRNPFSDTYDYNTSQSSLLDYKSRVYAGYLSTSFKLLKFFDVKSGFRYEYTETDAWFSNSGNVNIQPYGTYVPSLIISHKFKKNNTFKISYSHRIERPEYRDLNPFINASDPKNITTGNPNLHPEIGDKIELGYSKSFENGTTIYSTLFYRGNKDDIQSYTTYYPVYKIGDSTYYNVAVSSRQNVGREDNYGISFFISVPATSKINLRSNISGFQRYIINGVLPGNNISGFNYRINLNAAYMVTSTMSIEVFGNFNSPRINVQGKMPSFTTYNFAFRKQFYHKKGSIALTATNPFNEYVNQTTELTGTNFTSVSTRQLPYRSFGINITYKFGKLEFKQEKEIEDINLTNPPSGN